MAEQKRISELLEKYTADTLSEKELAELLAYFDIDSNKADALQQLYNLLASQAIIGPADAKRMSSVMDKAYIRLNKRLSRPKKNRLWRLMPYAAAIVLLFAVSVAYFIFKNKPETASHELVIDVNPGTRGATLTLANGKKVRLNSNIGHIADEGNVSIDNTNGELQYSIENDEITTESSNTLSTGNGETYSIVLPDGTKVWLNAATTLRYAPTKLERMERVVWVAGEAYFEVAKDKKRPFIVNSNGQKIEVLGTHFNVNTYKGVANTITTLAEGSVKVSTEKNSNYLKPGQQSITNGGTINIETADLETALAWKDGKIYFKDAPLAEVMDEIARWYDVQIKYEGKPEKALFNGGFSRSTKLSEVLEILKASNIQSKLIKENNQVTLVINSNKT